MGIIRVLQHLDFKTTDDHLQVALIFVRCYTVAVEFRFKLFKNIVSLFNVVINTRNLTYQTQTNSQ